MKYLPILPFAFAAMISTAIAGQEALPLEKDSRIRTFSYDENEVYILKTFAKTITTVELGEAEVIESILAGDSESWEIIRLKAGNIISIKPLIMGARSDLTVYTDSRVYTFELSSSDVDPSDVDGIPEGQAFRTKFRYPEEEAAKIASKKQEAAKEQDKKKKKTKIYNKYYASEISRLGPVAVYDNGIQTFFKFRKSSKKPAIFVVDEDRREKLINLRAEGNTLVADTVEDRWTIRVGSKAIAIKRGN